MPIPPLLPPKSPEAYEITDIQRLIKNATDLLLYIAGAVGLIYLIYGAILYFTAYGNEEKVNKAKQTIYWAIAGIAIIILAKIIVGEVFKILTGRLPSPPF